jgi:hypothetical protein
MRNRYDKDVLWLWSWLWLTGADALRSPISSANISNVKISSQQFSADVQQMRKVGIPKGKHLQSSPEKRKYLRFIKYLQTFAAVAHML